MLGGSGYGGALFVASGVVRLEACLIHDNYAEMASAAASWDASGGGVSIADGGILKMMDCRLWGNEAGGVGLYESTRQFGVYANTSRANRLSRAAHIDCAGRVELDRCVMLGGRGGERFHTDSEDAALPFMNGRGRAQIHAVNCIWTSTDPAATALRLVGDQSEALVRACRGENVTIDARAQSWNQARLAVLNSVFDPRLAIPARLEVCSAIVSGEQVCDPRAKCEARSSGGIQCTCAGDGLHDKNLGFPDGRECVQETQYSMQLMSENTVISIYKPSNGTAPIVISLDATGEAHVTLDFSMKMTRIASSSDCISDSIFSVASGNITRSNPLADSMLSTMTWSRIEEPTLSLDGYRITFRVPPSTDALFELDARLQQFSRKKEYTLLVSADCRGKQACIADGDTVETRVAVGSASFRPSLHSTVLIVARVVSLVSCDKSRIRLAFDGDAASQSSPIQVVFDAFDVDGQPINVTRAEVQFSIDGAIILHHWQRGSNAYFAELSSPQPGDHKLLVTVENAWNDAERRATRCLLMHPIAVMENSSLLTIWILVGSGSLFLVVAIAVMVWARKHFGHFRRRLQPLFSMLFSEGGKLLASISFETGDFVTDILTTHKARVSSCLLHGFDTSVH